MIVYGLVLFAVALVAGAMAFYFPRVSNGNYKLALVFAGSYLFSITIIHLLPDLYHHYPEPSLLGMFVVLGFFVQQALEFLSTGVEHGHLHVHDLGHHHSELSVLPVLIGLGVHSLLEGAMLAQPVNGVSTVSNPLLWGIVLHKAPEAFAFVSVLLCDIKNKTKAIIYLVVFALASPAGLLLNESLLSSEVISQRAFIFLMALVGGSFLHISTTILFESSVDHKFNIRKIGVAMVAAAVAVGAEIVLVS